MNKIFALLLAVGCISGTLFAQKTAINTNELDGRVNTITTAVPFLRIAPDARAGAMGDVGLATPATAASMHWNPAKLAFAEKSTSLTFSYTPWLKQLVDDIYLAYATGYKQLNDKQTIGISLLYFNLGNIQFTDIQGQDAGSFNPRELKTDVAIANKLTDHLSLSLALRYVYSNLASGQQSGGSVIKPGHAASADISTFYTNSAEISTYKSDYAFGMNISNLGTKISYTQNTQKDFIPMNLGLGGSFTLHLDEYNKFTFASDLNKLLVPTPVELDVDPQNGIYDYKEISVPAGLFSSFNDAPGGFSEEMAELIWSVGAEYWYADQFAVRGGYFHEAATKGNRQFLTAGIGLKFNVIGIDVSYLVPTNNQASPLDNTLRFALTFDFDELASANSTSDK
jgi:hypothetical protein